MKFDRKKTTEIDIIICGHETEKRTEIYIIHSEMGIINHMRT
jgi:hypothetical protein